MGLRDSRPYVPLNNDTPRPPSAPARPRVLIVDDEPAIRTIARHFLEAAGFAAVEATDAGDALIRVRAAERPCPRWRHPRPSVCGPRC